MIAQTVVPFENLVQVCQSSGVNQTCVTPFWGDVRPLRDPKLVVGVYRAHFRVRTAGVLPAFCGPTWRGALGFAMRGLFCSQRELTCGACPLVKTCPQGYLFETADPALVNDFGLSGGAPHPFALEVQGMGSPRTLKPGDEVCLGFRLFGRGNDYLVALIAALECLGDRGLGVDGARLTLERVVQDVGLDDGWVSLYEQGVMGETCVVKPAVVPSVPKRVRVVFETPLQIRRGGRPVGPQDFGFVVWFRALLRRYEFLRCLFDQEPEQTDVAGLLDRAQAVSLRDLDLEMVRFQRYSHRQKRRLEVHGLVGSF